MLDKWRRNSILQFCKINFPRIASVEAKSGVSQTSRNKKDTLSVESYMLSIVKTVRGRGVSQSCVRLRRSLSPKRGVEFHLSRRRREAKAGRGFYLFLRLYSSVSVIFLCIFPTVHFFPQKHCRTCAYLIHFPDLRLISPHNLFLADRITLSTGAFSCGWSVFNPLSTVSNTGP